MRARSEGGLACSLGVLFSSAAGGAYWPIAIRCPSLGPCTSIGGGAHRPLTTLCPSSSSLPYPSLSTSLSFPLAFPSIDRGVHRSHHSFPFLSFGRLCQRSPRTFPVSLLCVSVGGGGPQCQVFRVTCMKSRSVLSGVGTGGGRWAFLQGQVECIAHCPHGVLSPACTGRLRQSPVSKDQSPTHWRRTTRRVSNHRCQTWGRTLNHSLGVVGGRGFAPGAGRVEASTLRP